MESDQAHNTNSEERAEVSSSTGQAPGVESATAQGPQSRRWSKLALLSLILGLGGPLVLACLVISGIVSLSFEDCILGTRIMAIAGVCLGITALWQIKRSNKRLRGVVSAILGMVISCGILVALVHLVPDLQRYKEAFYQGHTIGYVGELCWAAIDYSVDHNGELPDSGRWEEDLASYQMHEPEDMLGGPFKPGRGRTFAMNRLLVNSPWGNRYDLLVKNTADPSRTVMFFETKEGKSAGGPELLPEEPAYPKGHIVFISSSGEKEPGDGYIIGFLDGHVSCVPKDQLHKLIWTPQGK